MQGGSVEGNHCMQIIRTAYDSGEEDDFYVTRRLMIAERKITSMVAVHETEETTELEVDDLNTAKITDAAVFLQVGRGRNFPFPS